MTIEKNLGAHFSSWQGLPKYKSHSFGQSLWNFEILTPLVKVKVLILPPLGQIFEAIRNFLLHEIFKCNLS